MIEEIYTELQRRVGKREILENQRNVVIENKLKYEEEMKEFEQALILVQTVAQATQEELTYRLSFLVTSALKAVFPDPYDFKIQFEIKRGSVEARMFFVRNKEEIDPMTSSGGGVVDVASFALRLSCLLLSKHPLRKTIILDEPFRFVSTDLQPKIGELLNELSVKLGIQFLIVSHEEELNLGIQEEN